MASFTSAVFALLKRIGGGEEVRKPHNNAHEDMISQLPDDILVSIIARTPTKFAASTSILSKRWRNLYKSMSSFKLSCDDLLLSGCTGDDSGLVLVFHRLERFLRLCSASKIHHFSFSSCFSKSCINQFEQCIYSLQKSGVEQLDLCLTCGMCPSSKSFSCHLLSKLHSLKHLSLHNCSLHPNLNIKSLRTLNLFCVAIPPASLECILLNCLGLHSLTIRDCRCPPRLCFRGPNLQLDTLIIIHCRGLVEMEFYATNLTKFEFRCHRVVKFVFDHVPQLESVFLSHDVCYHNVMPYVLGKLYQDLPHLKSLTFDTEGAFYQESIGLMPMGMVTFGNLRRLDMSVYCTPKTNLLALTPFLESCPLLEEFHFDAQNMDHDVAEQREHVILHTKLKMVEITGFHGTDNEIEFALYILKIAVALDQMFIIRCVRYYFGLGIWLRRGSSEEHLWKNETRNKIEQRLQGQALSKTAKLIIQHRSTFSRSIHHHVA